MKLVARDAKKYLLFQLSLCCHGKWPVFAPCFALQYKNILKTLFRTLVATGKVFFKNKFMSHVCKKTRNLVGSKCN